VERNERTDLKRTTSTAQKGCAFAGNRPHLSEMWKNLSFIRSLADIK